MAGSLANHIIDNESGGRSSHAALSQIRTRRSPWLLPALCWTLLTAGWAASDA